jgi:hypothetical protein
VSVVQMKDDLSGAPGKRVITARKPFDKSYFSKCELEIMEALAFMFDEINGEDMSDLSHPGARSSRMGRALTKRSLMSSQRRSARLGS